MNEPLGDSSNRGWMGALGPGILFAGAAIGVSHLVQSTRAGAGWGFQLLWAVLLVLLCKYPFFQYAHRYTAATGESMLAGYRRLGRGPLAMFMLIVAGSSFITMAAVTVVTAGLAGALLGLDLSLTVLSMAVLAVVYVLLAAGRYGLLDNLMKAMVLVLGTLTLVAVSVAFAHGPAGDFDLPSEEIWTVAGLTFLLALMGWMPAPLDVAVWPSLWMLEKHRGRKPPTMVQAMVDFHVGYFSTAILAVAFICFGALVMYGTGEAFSASGLIFSQQLVDMYTGTLGQWSRWIIALIAFITMFSTTLTVLDGYARTLAVGSTLLMGWGPDRQRKLHQLSMPLLTGLALLIIAVFMKGMKALVDVATVLAFLTAPFVAWLNFRVVRSSAIDARFRPGRLLTGISWLGLIFLGGVSLAWILIRWI